MGFIKMEKKTKNRLKDMGSFTLIIIILIVAIATLNNGITTFWVGFHNIDLGYNVKYINAEYDLELIDIGNDNIERTPSEMYRLGLDQIIDSLRYIFVSGLCFGVLYVILIRVKV